MEQAKKNKQSKKEAKCNAKPPKPKKRKIIIANLIQKAWI